MSRNFHAIPRNPITPVHHDPHGQVGPILPKNFRSPRILLTAILKHMVKEEDSSRRKRTASGSTASYIPQLQYKPATRLQLWVFDLVSWIFSVIFDCFFREIRPRGAFRLPKLGPVIFVAGPHASQFVDPIILSNQVRREAKRRVSFIIAAKSYMHPLIGPLSRCQLSIPVSRPQDMLVKGTGIIFIDFKLDALLVKGKGTQFTKECTPRGLIALPQSLGASEIVEVRSDTELVLKKEFKTSDKIIELLKKGTPFKIADKIDQKQVYQFVFDHLSNNQCLGIFPEGGSHDRPDMLPLKAGVAIMALGAMSNNPDCNVKIVPCGMNYFNAHKFRSRAVVEFGHPIEISRDLVAKYDNPETHRDAVKELLDTISSGLHAVTVNCPDYETLMVIQAARRLYAGNFAQYLPLPMVVEMNRRLLLGYETFKDRPEMKGLKRKILHYNEFLKQLNLPDHHVEDCNEKEKLSLLPIFFARVLKLLFFLVLALPGSILFSPVFIVSKRYSKQKAKTALANSTVKIKANDVVATWKILVGMFLAPVIYSFYASLGVWYCKHYNYFSSFGLFTMWLGLYLLGVLVTYSALITGEQGLDLFKSLRPLYLSMVSGSAISELKQLRRELSEEITDVVNRFGIELFPNDFNLLEVKGEAKATLVVDEEEEEMKTQILRNRRAANKKARNSVTAEYNSDNESDSDMSVKDDGSVSSESVSIKNTNSYTNIPMFSDYDLHMNAKNSQIDIKNIAGSALSSMTPSSVSIANDFNVGDLTTSPSNQDDLSEESAVEFNFAGQSKKNNSSLNDSGNISEMIKNRVRENRDKA